MRINSEAPALTRQSVEVAASPEAIWAVLTDISRWPEWNSDVTSTSIDGPIGAGTTFRWKAGPGTITSTLQLVEPMKGLAWTGRTMGIRAVHTYELAASGDTTTVTSEESWDGLMVRLMRRQMQKTLDAAIASTLAQLKDAAERQT
jgi:hypothetical protein